MTPKGFVFALLILFTTGTNFGATIAYQPQDVNGTQNFGGSLGMDFIVNSPIEVTQLGVFDSGFNGVGGGTLVADLWSRNDGGTPLVPGDDTGIAIIASQTFSQGAPGTPVASTFNGAAGNLMKPITPLILNPGAYTIVGHGYGAGDSNGNAGTGNNPIGTDNGGGLLTFVGNGRFNGTAGAFPNSVDGGPANRYHAGTFEFQEPAAAVPEPATFGWALLALTGLAFYRRRR